MTAPHSSLTDALRDRYAIERPLGRGGSATVYLAQDLRHHRPVALKVLEPQLVRGWGPERFRREIDTAARLEHPHILTVLDSGDAGGWLWYTMPYVEGETLRHRLNRERQLPLEQALRLTREAAEGLRYAHRHGVVHRDIKPENVLLSEGHARVADFGLAKVISAQDDEHLTPSGIALGSVHYMSPEQALGDDHVDGRSDVYSLGCLLYEMLTGQPPFVGSSPTAIRARHHADRVPSLRVVRDSIPDEVEATVLRALEKAPADRFQTMDEFADVLADLEVKVSTRHPIARSRSPSAPELLQTQATSKRARTFRVVAGAALVFLLVAGLLTWHRVRTESPIRYDPRRIAVVFFPNPGSGSDSLAYLAAGLNEALIHELSSVRALQVISMNGVSPFQLNRVAPHSIARALKVGTILEGRVAQSGNRLRVSVSIVNGTTGAELDSKTVERPRAELFELQDDLAREVAFFVRQRLGQELQVQEHRAGTTSPAAWGYLQRGRQEARDAEALLAAGDSAAAAAAFSRADSLLARAETADSRWAAPPSLRGWIDYRRSRLSPIAPPSYHAGLIQEGLRHADRALKLQPKDADALEVRGTLRYWQWLSNLANEVGQSEELYAEAERDLRASVEANPDQASAWTTLSHLLINKPALGEAKLAALRAYNADPYLRNANVTLWRLFTTSFDLEDAVEAGRWCVEGQRRFATDYRFAECQLWLQEMRAIEPDVPSAWKMLEKYAELSPASMRPFNRLMGQMRVAIVLARAGLADSARSVAGRSEGDPSVDANRNLSELAVHVYSILGDNGEALRRLSVYLAANPGAWQSMLTDVPWYYRELSADPRFAALVGRSE